MRDQRDKWRYVSWPEKGKQGQLLEWKVKKRAPELALLERLFSKSYIELEAQLNWGDFLVSHFDARRFTDLFSSI